MNNAIAGAIAAAAKAAPEFTGIAPVMLNPNKILLIDGDILAYSVAGTDDTPTGVARRNLFSKVRTLQEITHASSVVIHLTSSSSHKGYRYLAGVTQQYQGNRASNKRPKNWKALRDIMETYNGDAFKVKLWHDREADDGIAYHVAKLQATRTPEDIYMCTRDKDLRMITGCVHINWDDYTEVLVPRDAFLVTNPYDIDKPFGHKWFWIQMLMGDLVDNIRGVEGIGFKTACKLLAPCYSNSQANHVILGVYKRTYGDKAEGLIYEHSLLLWLRDTPSAAVTDVPHGCYSTDSEYTKILEGRISDYKTYTLNSNFS